MSAWVGWGGWVGSYPWALDVPECVAGTVGRGQHLGNVGPPWVCGFNDLQGTHPGLEARAEGWGGALLLRHFCL